MDITTQLTHISLCAGYGGIDLGLKRVIPDLRTVAVSEIEAFACANLVAKMEAGLMDAAPIWSDLKTFPYAEFSGRVDILSGGYPCQPFSSAGKRLGKDDPRHLWPWIADGIAAMRPGLCFFENVEGHISMGLSDVIEDLAGLGYRTTWGIFSASECGAPHRRKRVFILAYRSSPRLERNLAELSHSQGWEESNRSAGSSKSNDTARGIWPARPGHAQFDWEPPRVVGNAQGQRPAALRPEHERLGGQLRAPGSGCEGVVGNTQSRENDRRESGVMGVETSQGSGSNNATNASSEGLGNTTSKGLEKRSPRCVNSPVQAAECGDRSSNSRQAEPTMGGDADGLTRGLDYAELCISGDNRTDELRLLGNGVVPAVAELAFRTLLQQLLAH